MMTTKLESKEIVLIFFKTRKEMKDWDCLHHKLLKSEKRDIRPCLFHQFYLCGVSPSRLIFHNCSEEDVADEEVKNTIKMYKDWGVRFDYFKK